MEHWSVEHGASMVCVGWGTEKLGGQKKREREKVGRRRHMFGALAGLPRFCLCLDVRAPVTCSCYCHVP
jgi:hypothetical protein